MLAKIRRYLSYEQRAWRRYGRPYAVRLYNALEDTEPLSRIIIGEVIVSSSITTERLVCRDFQGNRLLEKSLLRLTTFQLSEIMNYLIWVLLSIFARSLKASVPQVGYTALVEDCVKIVPMTFRDKSVAQMILDLPSLDIAHVSKQTFSDIMAIVGQAKPSLLKEVEWEVHLGAVCIETHKNIDREIQSLSKR